MASPPSTSRSSLALSNLRAIVILIVLAFHSMLAYLQWIPSPARAFDSPPYDWRAFPIIDSHRFFGFDLFCAWQDIYLMSLMFFLSGLFVWSSLTRKRELKYLRDRVLRLGVPYIFGVLVLMPIASYPAYAVTASDPGIIAYWHALVALPFWPNGPLWFLWQLLAFNGVAAVLYWVAPRALRNLGRVSAAADKRFGTYLAALLALSALAYVPLAIAFTPWQWSESGLFMVQFCRPLLYGIYFFAGVGLGMNGIERGLLSVDGILARYWARWLAAALASLFLWMGLTGLTLDGHAPLAIRIAADLAFVPACATGCFFLIGVCLRFARGRSRMLDSLSVNAYGLYLVHYDFAVWLQYALLSMALIAIAKALIVFVGTLVLSWVAVVAVQRIPFGDRLIGMTGRAVTAS